MISKGTTGKLLMLLVFCLTCSATLLAGQWAVMGPDGGDVRSLTYDPQNPDRVFLGTSTGVLFVSDNGGKDWSRFAHLGTGDEYVLDHIVVNPQNTNIMYVSAWSAQSQQTGDIFRTHDGGKTWHTLPAMHGKSIRAMAMSASNPKVLVAGALDGVFRSNNGGNDWERMSPAGHAEIKNIESIAIDPKDPNVVYAGTWHLAWKTADGGANWQHINKGMIDDSDVFSIIVDHTNPANVFASACSGIYKSVTAGEQFSKIQGIPFSARRTRVLKQDPTNENIVYAGTTEGLWKTTDLGKTWKRISNPEVVVNDVYIDPRNASHVLLATDRSGVLALNASGIWTTSNHGYTHRYVTAIVPDQKDSNTIYVGVVNDREFGGVFFSRDNGQHWQQRSAGLGGKDVFTLRQASSGALVAGTNHGSYILEHNATEWRPINTVVVEKAATKTVKKGKKSTQVAGKTVTKSTLDARVNEVDISGDRWMEATTNGLYFSKDQGRTWMGGPVQGEKEFLSVRGRGNTVVAAARTKVYVSHDNGATFTERSLTQYVTSIRGVTLTPEGQIFVASREGAFASSDSGATWMHVVAGLPDKDITSIAFDPTAGRLLATSLQTGVVFQSTDNGRSWQRGPDSGYPLRRVSVVHGRFVGATPFDGVIFQPENEGQSAAAGAGGASN
jgi:photosystem II stability/assembly factor-like uncharacterized protein